MKGILRTLALTGIVAAAGAAAQAQVAIGVGIQPAYPVAYDNYVPACPGVGFVWTPGYYAGRIWVPGRWIHHDDYAFARRDFRYDHRDYHIDNRGWDHGRR
jgi:hypothetical protein